MHKKGAQDTSLCFEGLAWILFYLPYLNPACSKKTKNSLYHVLNDGLFMMNFKLANFPMS